MARARACPSVVLPTPGTPSMSKCPRAKTLTSASRTTSSLPRITRRRAFSSSAALWDTAMAVSGDIQSILLSGFGRAGVTYVTERIAQRPHQRERPTRTNLNRIFSNRGPNTSIEQGSVPNSSTSKDTKYHEDVNPEGFLGVPLCPWWLITTHMAIKAEGSAVYYL